MMMNNTNLKKMPISPRVLTALLGIPVVLAIVQIGAWLLAIVALLLACISLFELEKATRESSTRIEGWPFYFVTFIFYALLVMNTRGLPLREVSFYVKMVLGVFVALLVLSPLIAAILSYATPRKVSLLSLSLSVFAGLYVSLFAFIPLLQSQINGRALLWLTLFCVWTGDTLAYYGGRRFGKTKLTPLSPGKSREGALCGFVGSILIGALIGHFTAIGMMHGLILGAFVGVFAPLGDLAESFWKRELGVKDLGTILPGHGGVLDRCDSLLFAAPTVYFVAKLLGV
jgi:phosphatidate cytidylyltransferase